VNSHYYTKIRGSFIQNVSGYLRFSHYNYTVLNNNDPDLVSTNFSDSVIKSNTYFVIPDDFTFFECSNYVTVSLISCSVYFRITRVVIGARGSIVG
jgi:hypothetical protein